MTVQFFVAGIPHGAGSKKVFAVRKGGQPTGRFVVTDTSGKAGKDWRASVTQCAYQAMKEADLAPFTGPVKARLDFSLPRPKAHYRKDGSIKPTSPFWHTNTPDSGKLARAVFDAMTAIVWLDDKQVVIEELKKVYANGAAGCDITVEECLNRM